MLSFQSQYLGSTIVKELRGTESTKKSIQKLKRTDQIMGLSSKDLTTGPHSAERVVSIMISYLGVQFVDPQSNVSEC